MAWLAVALAGWLALGLCALAACAASGRADEAARCITAVHHPQAQSLRKVA